MRTEGIALRPRRRTARRSRAPARRRRRARTGAGARRAPRPRSRPARPRTGRPARPRRPPCPPGRRISIRVERECHGSPRNSEPFVPTTSRKAVGTMSKPQSSTPSTSPAKRSVADEPHVDAVAAEHLVRGDRLRLAGEQPHRAHAVAADVHQRPAVERRPRAARRPARSARRRCRTRTRRGSSAAARPPPRRRARGSRRACAWWRHMNASASTSPARSAASKAASASSGRRVSGFSQSTCLPASSARIDHGHVQRVGQRDVDRVDLRDPPAAPRRSRARGRARARPRTPRPAPASRLATATTSTPSATRAPPRSERLMAAVESRPRRSVMLVRIARARGARSSRR